VAPHKQPALQEFAEMKLPVTEQIHNEILSLPISPLLTEKEVARIIEAINTFNPSDDAES
jgi:dTDP-4-amino-4,6-dideoxygalactose transaminase